MTSLIRRLLPTPDTRLTAADWDRGFAGSEWDRLDALSEMARTAVIAGYARAAGREPAILDVGCGTGVMLDALGNVAYRQYVGLDVSAVAIAQAEARAGDRDTFTVGDARRFVPPVAPDVVIFNEVLYYFDDVAGTVARYLDLLAPDGVAIASVYSKWKTRRVWRALKTVATVRDSVSIRHRSGTAWRIALLAPKRTRAG